MKPTWQLLALRYGWLALVGYAVVMQLIWGHLPEAVMFAGAGIVLAGLVSPKDGGRWVGWARFGGAALLVGGYVWRGLTALG